MEISLVTIEISLLIKIRKNFKVFHQSMMLGAHSVMSCARSDVETMNLGTVCFMSEGGGTQYL